MKTALAFIREYKDPNLADLNLEEIVEAYQACEGTSLFAEAFDRVFLLALKEYGRFFTINQDEAVSIIFYELHRALIYYEAGKGKFSTLFVHFIVNAFRKQVTLSKTLKNNANIGALDYDFISTNGTYEEDQYAVIEASTLLTDEELILLRLLLGKNTMRDSAQLMKISEPKVYKIRRNIRKKFIDAGLTI